MAAGYKDFIAGATLAAADLEDYCELQSVMRFADTTARDTALSAVKTTGMFAVDVANKAMTVYEGSAWLEYGRFGSWVTSTPTLSNVTGGTVSMRAMQLGKSLFFTVSITAGTATAAGTVGITTAYTSANVITPLSCLIDVGGNVTTVSSARWSASSTGITLYGTSGGANLTLGQSAICRISGTIELA